MAEEKPTSEQTNTPKSDSVVVPPKKSSSSNKTLLIVVGVLVLIFVIIPAVTFSVFAVWLGSGDNATKLTEGIVESSTGADIDTKDGSLSITSKDGDEFSVGGEQEYADDFPAEVPKYQGGTVKSNIRSGSTDATYWSNSVDTPDDSDKVLAFYKQEMSGWTETSTFSINNSTTTSYESANLEATITVTPNEGGGTTISYYVTENKTASP
jgi:archaellin